MELSEQDLQYISEYAISAAEKAGQLISEHANKEVTVNSKDAGDSLASQVVTEVDLMSQEAILKELAPIIEKYDLAVLTEETPDDGNRLKSDYFWCIDPLDGTLPFIESMPGYAVSIALVAQSGIPWIGVIFDPVHQVLYHAIKGQGAYKNRQKWSPQPENTNTLTFINDRSFLKHPLFEPIMRELAKMAGEQGYHKIERIFEGGAAMNACWLVEKQPACYFKFPKPQDGGGSLWDYAASACIVKEAGAWVSNIHGRALDLNRNDSTYMNHEGILYASDNQIAEIVKALFKKL